MPIRGFGIQTLTGTAQPAVGTTITQAINPTPDRYRNDRGLVSASPSHQASTATCTVTSILFFRVGDRVLLGTAAQLTAGTNDSAKITLITPGSGVTGTLGLQGLTAQHSSGEFLVLSIPVGNIILQPGATNTAAFYIGEDSTVAAGSPTLIQYITQTQAAAGVIFSPNTSPQGCVLDTPRLWVNGTANDTYLPSVVII